MITLVKQQIVSDVSTYPLSTLLSLFHHLTKEKPIEPLTHLSLESYFSESLHDFDMQDIRGQHQAKRALEIAAAGSHNLLLKGPPGAGKHFLPVHFPPFFPSYI